MNSNEKILTLVYHEYYPAGTLVEYNGVKLLVVPRYTPKSYVNCYGCYFRAGACAGIRCEDGDKELVKFVPVEDL